MDRHQRGLIVAQLAEPHQVPAFRGRLGDAALSRVYFGQSQVDRLILRRQGDDLVAVINDGLKAPLGQILGGA